MSIGTTGFSSIRKLFTDPNISKDDKAKSVLQQIKNLTLKICNNSEHEDINQVILKNSVNRFSTTNFGQKISNQNCHVPKNSLTFYQVDK